MTHWCRGNGPTVSGLRLGRQGPAHDRARSHRNRAIRIEPHVLIGGCLDRDTRPYSEFDGGLRQTPDGHPVEAHFGRLYQFESARVEYTGRPYVPDAAKLAVGERRKSGWVLPICNEPSVWDGVPMTEAMLGERAVKFDSGSDDEAFGERRTAWGIKIPRHLQEQYDATGEKFLRRSRAPSATGT